MVKTKKEIKEIAEECMDMEDGDDARHSEGFIEGYTEAQKNMMKYKKAFDILNCYFDSISDEEKPKVAKQLEKLGV